MQKEITILDEAYDYSVRNVVLPNEEARVAVAAWSVGSHFVEQEDLLVFDNFPILAFLSPDENSGKTRALDVTGALCYNPIESGSLSTASLLREIDKQQPKMITILLDEADETFRYNKDAADYIRLFNNGYQRGKYIIRASVNQEGENIKTMAYCPKALAGLTTTHLKKTTRSRMICIRMRPKKDHEHILRHLDREDAKRIVGLIEDWKPTVIQELKNIDEDRLSNLTNRAAQIWHPLLAIGKVVSEDWYQRILRSAMHFNKIKPDDSFGKKILKELYRCYLMPEKYQKNIRGSELESELRKRGFNLDGLRNTVSYVLGANGYGIPISQIKKTSDQEHPNQNGWQWEDCVPFFSDHLTDEERTETSLLVYQ